MAIWTSTVPRTPKNLTRPADVRGSAQWPSLLERLIPRLDLVPVLESRLERVMFADRDAKIVYNMFPTPSIPLPEPPLSSARDERSGHLSGENTPSQNSSKENIILETPPAGQSPRLRHLPMSPPPFRPSLDSSITGPPGTLPPQLLSLLSSLRSTLKTSFATAPPHTAQRLAELILRPTHHYRTLPSYLRALDRVLSVSSPANVFPLPVVGSSMASANGRLLNGSSTPDSSNTPGGDDFVGGAVLTPIPWLNVTNMASYLSGERPYMSDLRTESTSLIDGPNGAGSLETVTVSMNGISRRARDELPGRPERMGAGPLSSHPLHENPHSHSHPHPHPHPHSNGTVPSTMDDDVSGVEMEDDMDEEEEEERAIARGPDVIGMEDIGPQGPNAQTFAVDTSPERSRQEEPFSAHREQRSAQRDDDGRSMTREETTRPQPDPPDQDRDQHTYKEREREREREGERGNEEGKDDTFSSSSRTDDIMHDATDATTSLS